MGLSSTQLDLTFVHERDVNGPAQASDEIYVTNIDNDIDFSITRYPGAGNGNLAPDVTINGSNTGLADPWGIAVASSGTIYSLSQFGGASGVGSITVYPPASNGNVAPSATIAGANTGLLYPLGIALDSSANIYVANTLSPSITVYPAGAAGNVAPSATIVGSATGLDFPFDVALDSKRKVYVLNFGARSGGIPNVPSITVYAAGSNGNVTPSQTISGSNTELNDPLGIASDSVNVYVANEHGGPLGQGSITVYAAGSNGNVTPSATIAGSSTGLCGPSRIAIGSTGNLFVTNGCGGAIGAGSVTVYPAGSSGNVTPVATISGSNTGLNNPVGVAIQSFTYVALGDSIPTGQSRVSCPTQVGCTATSPLPATRGYPFRLNDLLRTVKPTSTVHDLAIVSATTVDVTLKQLPQIACPATTNKFCPDLVTITIGANDLGILDPLTLARFLHATQQTRQQVAAMLAAQLANTLMSMVEGVRIRAPRAQIIVLTNYPNPSDPRSCAFVSGAFDDIFFAGSFTGLNEVIQAVANQNGAVFVDAYNQFTNHGIQSGNSWFAGSFCGLQPQGLRPPPFDVLSVARLLLFRSKQGFDPHPNAAGQQCFANVIWEGIKGSLGSHDDAKPPCLDNLNATASP
jgi:lysophospholipase L1-like esterase